MVEKKEWDMLLKFDQLKLQKRHGLAYSDFEEAEITFAPTFKLDPHGTTYDSSEKQRTPSWTDRILWLSWHEGTIESLYYKAHHDVMLSDHRPVSSLLKVQVSWHRLSATRSPAEPSSLAGLHRHRGET